VTSFFLRRSSLLPPFVYLFITILTLLLLMRCFSSIDVQAEARNANVTAPSSSASSASSSRGPVAVPTLAIAGIGGLAANQDGEALMGMEEKKMSRPMSARRAPPKVVSAHLISEEADRALLFNEAQKSQTNTNSTMMSGMAPLPGSLVSGVIRDDEQAAEEKDEEEEAQPDVLVLEDDVDISKAGRLVTDIMKSMESHKKEDSMKRLPSSSLVRPGTAMGSRQSLQQLSELKGAIQKLSASANPIGKFLDMVHEDMDQMNVELSRWRKEREQYTEKLEAERSKTISVLTPLQEQLSELETQLQEQRRLSHQLKATILRYDVTIQQMLEQRSAVDGV